MDTLRLKRLLAPLYGLRSTSRSRDMVLLYHAVGDGPSAMPVDAFKQQMEWLSSATTVVPLDQLLGKQQRQIWRVAITFDDGYESVFQNAFPIMRTLGLMGTVYINTGWIGDRVTRASNPALGHYEGENFLHWSNVLQLARAGWTIGSHGVEHADLTAVDDARMDHELCASKADIESRVGASCKHFAFTWGHYSKREQIGARDAGYRTAASAIHGPLTGSDDMYALPRLDVANRYALRDFQAIVRGDWDFIGNIQRVRARLRGYG